MKVYVFPGQGSQQKGMGEGLFAQFRHYTRLADEVLGYSIEALCMEDPKNQLGQTQYTQPALYVVEALRYLRVLQENPNPPDYVAGHSLGEYVALYAAGAFEFEDGLALVKRRGEIMSQVSGGGMAAIVGIDADSVRRVLDRDGAGDIDVANFNSTRQTVISGPKESIQKMQSKFEAAGATVALLPVSASFHSRSMQPAGKEFAGFLNRLHYRPLQIPAISNVHARPYAEGAVAQNLTDQIYSSVRWTETIRFLLAKGAAQFEEIGPGKVLTNLIAAIRRETPAGASS
jgi:malonyl CoA-acyl carrier protein transacylase